MLRLRKWLFNNTVGGILNQNERFEKEPFDFKLSLCESALELSDYYRSKSKMACLGYHSMDILEIKRKKISFNDQVVLADDSMNLDKIKIVICQGRVWGKKTNRVYLCNFIGCEEPIIFSNIPYAYKSSRLEKYKCDKQRERDFNVSSALDLLRMYHEKML